MRLQSRILGDLVKSAKGNAKPEDQDTNIQVPSLFINTLNIPKPLQEVYSATQAGKLMTQTFVLSFEYNYNVNPGTTAILTLDSGLWEIFWRLNKRIAGAVSDLTSFTSLGFNLLDGGSNPGTQLANISNGQTLPEGGSGNLVVLIPSPNTIQINNTNAIGLATGLNLALITIVANRRY